MGRIAGRTQASSARSVRPVGVGSSVVGAVDFALDDARAPEGARTRVPPPGHYGRVGRGLGRPCLNASFPDRRSVVVLHTRSSRQAGGRSLPAPLAAPPSRDSRPGPSVLWLRASAQRSRTSMTVSCVAALCGAATRSAGCPARQRQSGISAGPRVHPGGGGRRARLHAVRGEPPTAAERVPTARAALRALPRSGRLHARSGAPSRTRPVGAGLAAARAKR